MNKVSKEDNELLIVSGSRLYGSNTEESDYDSRGCFIPSVDNILGLNPFDHYTDNQEDYQSFSIKKFVTHLLNNDPQTIELLYAPENCILVKTDIGQQIMDLKPYVVSQKIIRRIMGFSNSEWRKAKCEKMIIENRTKTEDDVILDIRNIFSPDKESMDLVLEELLKNKAKTIVPSTTTLGAKRKKQYEKFGYCTSSASHSIRLLGQLYELVTTGNIVFPRPNADFLRDIKLGKHTIQELDIVYNDLKNKIDSVTDIVIREKPDVKNVNKILISIYEEYIKSK